MKKLIVARHGLTPDNIHRGGVYYDLSGNRQVSRGKVYSGQNAAPLNASGFGQAWRAGQQANILYPWVQGACWRVSALLRTRQTFAGMCAGAGLDSARLRWLQSTELFERSAGQVTGMTHEEAADVWPELARGGRASVFNDVDAAFPKGESLRDVHDRAWPMVGELLETESTIVLVSSELTLKAIIAELTLGVFDGRAFEITVPNAEWMVFQSSGSGWQRQA